MVKNIFNKSLKCLILLLLVLSLTSCETNSLSVPNSTSIPDSDNITNSVTIPSYDSIPNSISTTDDYHSLYDQTIEEIDKDSYDEIGWMSGEPTGAVIVYAGYMFSDINADGIDELFVIRKYVNNQSNSFTYTNVVASLSDFKFNGITKGFISESYGIVNGKVEPLIIDYEWISTQAFQGGHFGIYYFLLKDGKIGKFSESYWEEILEVFDGLKNKETISFNGDNISGEWWWEINGEKVSNKKAIESLNKLLL